MVNCLVCLQYGMLTLLMLHPGLEKSLQVRFDLFISVTLALTTIFWSHDQVKKLNKMYLLKSLFILRGRD